MEQWKHLDGVENKIAEQNSEVTVQSGQLGYHHKCYMKYTEETKIERAVKHCTKEGQAVDDVGIEKSARPVRTSRTQQDSTQGQFHCKWDKYVRKSHSRKRQRENLRQRERQ